MALPLFDTAQSSRFFSISPNFQLNDFIVFTEILLIRYLWEVFCDYKNQNSVNNTMNSKNSSERLNQMKEFEKFLKNERNQSSESRSQK